MAEIKEIQDELNISATALMQEKGVALSTSPLAEWKLWTYIMAVAVKMVELLVGTFTADITKKIINTRVGTVVWYAEESKKFEYGNQLTLLDDGSLGYVVPNAELQIISNSSVTEDTATGDVYIKICKKNESAELVKLNDAELLSFRNYVNDIKTAGTRVNVLSYDPDVVKYEIAVYYDLGYDPATLQDAVMAALEAFKLKLDFNGVIYHSKLIQALLNVDGVVTVNIVSLMVRAYNTSYSAIGISSEMASGYFNFAALDGTAPDISVLTMVPIDQL